jgi:hypothetical protein
LGCYYNAIFALEDEYGQMSFYVNGEFASLYETIFIYTCLPLTDNELLVDWFVVLTINHLCCQGIPTLPTFCF